jgi:hypothetical protein
MPRLSAALNIPSHFRAVHEEQRTRETTTYVRDLSSATGELQDSGLSMMMDLRSSLA